MNRAKTKSQRRKPVNLSLTGESITMLEKLQQALNRPSKSNTAEALIFDKAKELNLVAA